MDHFIIVVIPVLPVNRVEDASFPSVDSTIRKQGIFGINWKFFTYTRIKNDNFSVYVNLCQNLYMSPKSITVS